MSRATSSCFLFGAQCRCLSIKNSMITSAGGSLLLALVRDVVCVHVQLAAMVLTLKTQDKVGVLWAPGGAGDPYTAGFFVDTLQMTPRPIMDAGVLFAGVLTRRFRCL
eukprot:TRINITY_DN5333_c0_g1_i2.p3 TRINITY_DN5333_c0_g1~~TRINITY_DN5333_c0_g1_i2.p3  ORF type:complete len:108 (-),score=2.30 TRINITY_DN5333_c0_g1_i2:578-901(-)